MTIGWSALTFTPSSEALHSLRSSWSWLLPLDAAPLLFSIFGDVFYQGCDGEVNWLNTGTAEITRVAGSSEEFKLILAGECDEWFLPGLVEALHREGKVPAAGECYTYAILPIFTEGKLEPWNFKPVPASEHFQLTASIHQQVAALPDGQKVSIRVVP